MAVYSDALELETGGNGEIRDLTPRVQKVLSRTGLANGTVTVFVPGSTGAVATMEYEPGLVKDLSSALERVAPSGIEYEHHKTWHDDNGKSHVRATLIGPGLVVPFVEGKLTLGTWQQIVFIDLDTSPRKRRLIVQVMGE
jgi:secondary thiamine-phosphate synthase enzyme